MKKDLPFISLFLFIFAGFFILSGALSELFAEDIIIFSPSHSQQTDTSRARGVLKLEISSFTPISKVVINKKVLKVKGNHKVIKVPYALKPGENEFEILVVAGDVEEERLYVLYYTEPGKKRAKRVKKRFSMITVTQAVSTDNVFQSSDSSAKESGLKISFLAKPALKLTAESDLYLVMLREKYSNSDHKALEIIFNQLGGTLDNLYGFEELSFLYGLNDIGNELNGFSAANKLETDVFMGLGYKLGLFGKSKIDFLFRLTYKMLETNPGGDYDPDGLLNEFKGTLNLNFDNFKTKVKAGQDQMSAKGKYLSYATTSMGIEASMPLSKTLTGKAGVNTKSTAFSTMDPSQGISEKTDLNKLNLKIEWQTSIQGFLAMGEMIQNSQTSNVGAKEYSDNQLGVYAIYIF